ncbi:MAG TPA: hypothetical protein VLL48_04255 [Longimicrobiales bacterium]|nr:hypothetical protein [Longimicrobiales bacterium]
MTAPLLLAANPHAFFQVADSLSAAERYYMTIPDLAHNEFISQGIMAGSTGAGRGGYEALVETVRRFLDGYLKDDPASLDALMEELGSTVIGGDAPHIE